MTKNRQLRETGASDENTSEQPFSERTSVITAFRSSFHNEWGSIASYKVLAVMTICD
ncbi:hypothetical protein PHLCEN_2v2839 [Hermanssonia centrifuga]|uniref:Uncharacterized protein n=1 Tax=Hermanssonia centrifuga TaxID=98765 RepID=A0A2R6RI47_9APHY|nr:hypothetical protein PHLCEN_2v2839 [Hermanssonia centrifuga]